ncbi:MAG TPA: Lrp/AsnC family transcriptional regulator [Blastocatellia bacterium]|nr:Lrp/AsnC family transcriptional regulator [Blastocatellia bacterium]
MIDDLDRQILNILQGNARTSNAEIARQVGMAPSAVLDRIRKLEERGVVKGYGVQLDGQSVGLGLLAFVFVRTDDMTGENKVTRALSGIPEVLELHHVAGEDCFLVKVRAANTEALGRLLREKFGTIKGVRTTRTTIVLRTSKETTALPLDQEGEGDLHD